MDLSSLLTSYEDEFSGYSGDSRHEQRAQRLVERQRRSPDRGLPHVLDDAQLEAAYRLFNNPKVTFDALTEPHAQKSAERCAEVGDVLVVHDTTYFIFSGTREGLGFINKNNRGFLSHVSLAVSANHDAFPLGVVRVENWVRSQNRSKKDVPQHKLRSTEDCESHRWLRAVRDSTQRLKDPARAVHVMDREGDIYDSIATMNSESMRFVVRAAANRKIESQDPEKNRLFDALKDLVVRYRKTVTVSSRKAAKMPDQSAAHPAREGRVAKLAVAATSVVLKRTRNAPNTLPEETSINLVHAYEPEPPEGQPAVEWILATSEPIETEEHIERVLESYRRRWLIEEYFKAIKTGCAFQKRQFASFHALQNVLALYLPIAWGMLLARAQSRHDEGIAAHGVLSELRLMLLRKKSKDLPENPTLGEIAYAIARLGGHIRRNGPPGWQTLQRGFLDLLLLEEGAILYREMTQGDM